MQGLILIKNGKRDKILESSLIITAFYTNLNQNNNPIRFKSFQILP